jgi:hypothetical protein
MYQRTLFSVLEQKSLLTPEIEAEWQEGLRYWSLERELAEKFSQNSSVSIEDVLHTSERKSFDYRILNLLLFKLRDVPVDQSIMEAIFYNEHLVTTNSFYTCFLLIYN